MSLRFPERWWAALLLIPPFAMAGAWHRDAGAVPALAAPVGRATATTAAGPAPLRVCADPNNLPFSNRKEEGFENRIARVIAADLGRPLQYTWWPQQRGHIRKSLKAGACDLIPGIASSVDMVLTTRPYYRSTYVFVQRAGDAAKHRVRSFDDPVLRRLTIGVQLIGDDYTNTPPAHALGRRGIVGNVRGYSVYGDYESPNPPARIMDAVERGEVDVAVVWGPLAGWFARDAKGALVLTPVSPQVDLPFLPFVFDISMGVRRDDPATRAALEGALARERVAIARILDEYGIPRVGAGAPPGGER
ncbi:MAG TPA: substrate-binding domain-containing protein [Gemmatimonadaceae bacterium]